MATASEIRNDFLGGKSSPLHTQPERWEALRAHMRANGCLPEARDVASAFAAPQIRKGWKAPDGSWVACDGAC